MDEQISDIRNILCDTKYERNRISFKRAQDKAEILVKNNPKSKEAHYYLGVCSLGVSLTHPDKIKIYVSKIFSNADLKQKGVINALSYISTLPDKYIDIDLKCYYRFHLEYLTKIKVHKLVNEINDSIMPSFITRLVQDKTTKRLIAVASNSSDPLYLDQDELRELYDIVFSDKYGLTNTHKALYEHLNFNHKDGNCQINLFKHLLKTCPSIKLEQLYNILVMNMDEFDDTYEFVTLLQENKCFTTQIYQLFFNIISSSNSIKSVSTEDNLSQFCQDDINSARFYQDDIKSARFYQDDIHITYTKQMIKVIRENKYPNENKIIKAIIKFVLLKNKNNISSKFYNIVDIISTDYDVERFYIYIDIVNINNNKSTLNLVWKTEQSIEYRNFINLTSIILKNQTLCNNIATIMQWSIQLGDKFINMLIEKLQIDYDWETLKYEVQHLFLIMHHQKYPEKPLDEVMNDFRTVKHLLSNDELDKLKQQYLQIKEIGETLINKSNDELMQYVNDNKRVRNNCDLMLIAIIREKIKRCFSIYPYNVQCINLLALLSKNRRIAQIKTGEGKSSLICMLATYTALQSHVVDVISTSSDLTSRDANKFKPFYESLGLSVGYIEKNQYIPSNFSADIIYGTNYDFEFAYLHEKTKGSQHGRGTRPYDTVIVDEVDSMFIDMQRNMAILSIASKNQYPDLLYKNMWKWYIDNISELRSSEELHSFILNFMKEHNYNEKITLKQAKKWFNSMYIANIYEENKEYVVSNDRGTKKINIVDFRNTGQISESGSRWQNGIHSFIEAKHNIPIVGENQSQASISHVQFFNLYKNLIGLTGTLGSEYSRNELFTLYNCESYDSPPYKPSLKRMVPHIASLDDNQYNLIRDMVDTMYKSNRPTLILCLTIEESKKIFDLLRKDFQQIEIYNGVQKKDANEILALAGLPRAITVATNTAGRGADICVSSDAEANGGLHVIVSFIASNTRVEEQAFGRTGRQGQRGTYHYILDNDMYESTIEKRNCMEKKLSEDSIKYNDVIQMQFMLQSMFFELPSNYKQEHIMKWAEFKTDTDELIKDFKQNQMLEIDNTCINLYQQLLDKKGIDIYCNVEETFIIFVEDLMCHICKKFIVFWDGLNLKNIEHSSPLAFAYYLHNDYMINMFKTHTPECSFELTDDMISKITKIKEQSHSNIPIKDTLNNFLFTIKKKLDIFKP
jgi:hypothetical protein